MTDEAKGRYSFIIAGRLRSICLGSKIVTHFAVIGAGITGVTTAFTLSRLGYEVTVFDKNRYPGMETSLANVGQIS